VNLCFLDPTPMSYTPSTPYQAPLGGSQSALCYLSAALATLGCRVTLMNRIAAATTDRGVRVVPFDDTLKADVLREADVVVSTLPGPGAVLRETVGRRGRLVLWTQHASDQPAVQVLSRPECREAWDAFAFVSDWQREQYLTAFKIEPARSSVLRNAVGPVFEALLSALPDHPRPPALAYTSTPFRGLDVLLDAFPRIRAAIPDVQLKIFSSMRVYQQDDAGFAPLYQKAGQMPGVEVVGSLGQRDLAQALAGVAVLAYPNTFPETSCIAVMEALAAGCIVVTSRLGALPETTHGLARLIDPERDPLAHAAKHAAAVTEALLSARKDPQAAASARKAQADYVRSNLCWAGRAREWRRFLLALLPGSRRLALAGRQRR
jgi:glycosyltransferase involved in cell wall biosynthesis